MLESFLFTAAFNTLVTGLAAKQDIETKGKAVNIVPFLAAIGLNVSYLYTSKILTGEWAVFVLMGLIGAMLIHKLNLWHGADSLALVSGFVAFSPNIFLLLYFLFGTCLFGGHLVNRKYGKKKWIPYLPAFLIGSLCASFGVLIL